MFQVTVEDSLAACFLPGLGLFQGLALASFRVRPEVRWRRGGEFGTPTLALPDLAMPLALSVP